MRLLRLMAACALLSILSACVSINSRDRTAAALETTAEPPQVWSHHEQLSMAPEACAAKAERSMQALSYQRVKRNDLYTYGVFGANRGVIKCVANEGGSFVYLMVAGPDKKEVERLRNELANAMRP